MRLTAWGKPEYIGRVRGSRVCVLDGPQHPHRACFQSLFSPENYLKNPKFAFVSFSVKCSPLFFSGRNFRSNPGPSGTRRKSCPVCTVEVVENGKVIHPPSGQAGGRPAPGPRPRGAALRAPRLCKNAHRLLCRGCINNDKASG